MHYYGRERGESEQVSRRFVFLAKEINRIRKIDLLTFTVFRLGQGIRLFIGFTHVVVYCIATLSFTHSDREEREEERRGSFMRERDDFLLFSIGLSAITRERL